MARTHLNPWVFVLMCFRYTFAGEPCFRSRAPRCAGGTHLAERERNNIDYGPLVLVMSKGRVVSCDKNQNTVFRLTSRLVVSAREVFEVLRLRQMRKHRCLL